MTWTYLIKPTDYRTYITDETHKLIITNVSKRHAKATAECGTKKGR